MSELNELRHAGHSTTSRAWLTNPVRRVFFKIMAPYLAHQMNRIADLEQQHSTLRNMQAALQGSLQNEGDQLSALADRLRGTTLAIDGLRKDQLAINHRFAGLEDELDELRALPPAEARAAIASEGQLLTLQHNHPLAIAGTSLIVHHGTYGKFLLRQGDLISDALVRGEFWDPHLKAVIERFGRADLAAIDAGAYLGFHSAYMSRYFGTVYAFEPQTEMYRVLCANLLLNNCRNVIARNMALYDVAGRMRLADPDKQEIAVPMEKGRLAYDCIGNAAALMFQLAEDPAEAGVVDGSVPCCTIDSLDIKNLGFIKIDTQGSDLHVLRGARETIRKCRPGIVAEYEHELAQAHGDTLEDFHAFFSGLDYSVTVLEDRGGGKQIDLLAIPN